jgi:tetratricopeptide (TPR) repeat protein
MRGTARIVALHGALWSFDRWYRVSWYVWPGSLALLIVGWICVGKSGGIAFSGSQIPPGGSWSRPINSPANPGAKAPALPANWKQEKMATCFSKNTASSISVGACTELIITGLAKGRELAALHTQRGFLEREEKPEMALAEYNNALKIQPDFAEALNNRAWINMTRGDYDAAVQDLNKAISSTPPASAAIAHYYRGYAFLKLKNYPEALTDLNEAQRIQPDNADIYLARGEVRQAQENYPQALEDFDEFSKRVPKDVRGPVSRGSVLEAMGRTQDALTAVDDALALEPGNAFALAERDRLRAPPDEGSQPK